MRTDVSPMWLTYFMVEWTKVKQAGTDQRCTMCGGGLMKTEVFTDPDGANYEGYVCHADKQVTWLKVDQG